MASLTIGFATYVAGFVRDVAVDAQGNVVAVGGTFGQLFATTPGVFPRNPAGRTPAANDPSDVFVLKLSPTGDVRWAGLLGGPNHERAYGVEVDQVGDIYIAGRAGAGFPVTQRAFQTSFQGGNNPAYGAQDGFVCKLAGNGRRVHWCSYFGASDDRIVRDLAVDARGAVYLGSAKEAGSQWTRAVADAFRNAPQGDADGVVAKVRPDGRALLWARYIGGSAREGAQASIQVDAGGTPYVLVSTQSSDAPTPGGADRSYGGGGDLYLARLDPRDGAVVWATYVGGSGLEETETHQLAVSAQGEAVVVGPTTSRDFPTTAQAFQRQTNGGAAEVFVARFRADGALRASTLLGGAALDRAEGVAIGVQGTVHVTGTTTSNDFPTAGPFQASRRGGRDGFVAIFGADLDELQASSYYGGGGEEFGRTAATGPQAVTVVGGETDSHDLPSATGPKGRPGFVVRFIRR